MSERTFNILVGCTGAVCTCACTILGIIQPPNFAMYIGIIGAVETCIIEICSVIEGKTAAKNVK